MAGLGCAVAVSSRYTVRRMNAPPSQDAAELVKLMRTCAEGDRGAFEVLYRRTSDKLFGLSLRMLRDRGAAEDALQNVYTNVWLHADRFDPSRAAVMTWLITMTRNQCIDHLRRHREEPIDTEFTQQIVDPDTKPLEASQADQQSQHLKHCLDALDEQQRKAVRAAFFTGATYNQLADDMEVPLGTMKSWIRRSLIRLRACLEQLEVKP